MLTVQIAGVGQILGMGNLVLHQHGIWPDKSPNNVNGILCVVPSKLS